MARQSKPSVFSWPQGFYSGWYVIKETLASDGSKSRYTIQTGLTARSSPAESISWASRLGAVSRVDRSENYNWYLNDCYFH